MSATTDSEAFVAAHDPCGELTADGSPATAEGYRMFLTCCCGAQFDAWLPLAEASAAMAQLVNPD